MAELSDFAKELLNEKDSIVANVFVREWGNRKVRLRSWSGEERIQFDAETAALEAALGEEAAGQLLIARSISWSLVDDAGEPLFPRVGAKAIEKITPPADAAETVKDKAGKKFEELLAVYLGINRKNGKGLLRLWRIVADHNALDAEAEEQIEKN